MHLVMNTDEMVHVQYAGTTCVSITHIPLEILIKLEGCYKMLEINSYKQLD